MAGSESTIVVLPEEQPVSRGVPPASMRDLRDWFFEEVEQAISARFHVEALWRDCLRMYEGQPIKESVDVPIPNAPNLEVQLGAIASDAIYAQAIDTIFQISPPVTVRATHSDFVEHAKDLQRFVNWGVANEWKLREAANHAILDDVQLGTGVYYIPWVERRRKTLTLEYINKFAPEIFAVPIEDFLVPGASPPNLSQVRWMAMRSFLTGTQLGVRAKLQGWDIEGVQTAAAPSFVRERREALVGTQATGEARTDFYEIIEGYVAFDIDDDGVPEDLLITYDRSSRAIARVVPNPYDRCWPFEIMQYQPRPHLFHGIGVIEMLRSFEMEATEIHNARVLNMLLANARLIIGKEGIVNETMQMWPFKVIPTPNPKEDFIPWAMADVYPSSHQAEAIVLQYAERRSGINDLAQGRANQLGSRTPGITALTALQAVNQRFTPAFDAKRMATAGAVKQCLYRYQERALANDPAVRDKLDRVLGSEAGARVFGLLRSREFDDGIMVELTASSASINRDADKQNAIMLVNVLGQYYTQLLELINIVSNPLTPEPVQKTGMRIVDAASEAIDRVLRTFDTVRDPATFIVRLKDVFAEAGGANITDQAIGQLLGAMAAQGGQGNGQMPVEGAFPGSPEGMVQM